MTDPAYGYSGPNFGATWQQDVQAFNNSPNNLQNILGGSLSGLAPQVQQSELQAALAGNQFGVNLSQYGLTTTNLEQQAANQLGQLGISQAQLGIQGQGLQAQAQLLGFTSGLEQKEYGLQQQQYAQEATQYPEQMAEAALNYTTNKENLLGNLAATGATKTAGGASQQDVLAHQAYWQAADINRAQAEFNLGQQQSQLQQQGTLAQQQYSAADIARQQQNLQLLAESNGLSVQEVQQQLGYGLSQAGLDVQQSLPQLLNSLSSIYGGDLSAVQGQLGQLGLLGNTSLANVTNAGGLNAYSPGVSGL